MKVVILRLCSVYASQFQEVKKEMLTFLVGMATRSRDMKSTLFNAKGPLLLDKVSTYSLAFA